MEVHCEATGILEATYGQKNGLFDPPPNLHNLNSFNLTSPFSAEHLFFSRLVRQPKSPNFRTPGPSPIFTIVFGTN